MLAARRSEWETVFALSDHGANINACDDEGDTVLHYAAYHNKTDVISKLIKVGADIEARNKEGRTPILEAMFSKRRDLVTVSALIDLGSNVNVRAG